MDAKNLQSVVSAVNAKSANTLPLKIKAGVAQW